MTAEQFRPTFSTSQAKAEQKKAERQERYEEDGRGYVTDNSFGEASSVFPEVKPQPKERTVTRDLQPPPIDARMPCHLRDENWTPIKTRTPGGFEEERKLPAQPHDVGYYNDNQVTQIERQQFEVTPTKPGDLARSKRQPKTEVKPLTARQKKMKW